MDDEEDIRSASVNYITTRYCIPNHSHSFRSEGHADPRHHRIFYKYQENYPYDVKPRPLRYPTTELHRYIRDKGRRHHYKPCSCCDHHKFFRSKSALSTEQYRRYWESQLWNNQVCYYYEILVLLGFCPALQLASGLYGGDSWAQADFYSEEEEEDTEEGDNSPAVAVRDGLGPDEDTMNRGDDRNNLDVYDHDDNDEEGEQPGQNEQGPDVDVDAIEQVEEHLNDVTGHEDYHQDPGNEDPDNEDPDNEDLDQSLNNSKFAAVSDTVMPGDILHNAANNEDFSGLSRHSSSSSVDFEIIDRSHDDEDTPPSTAFCPSWKSSSVILVKDAEATTAVENAVVDNRVPNTTPRKPRMMYTNEGRIITNTDTRGYISGCPDKYRNTRRLPCGINIEDTATKLHGNGSALHRQGQRKLLVRDTQPMINEHFQESYDETGARMIRPIDHCGTNTHLVVRTPAAQREAIRSRRYTNGPFNDRYSMARHYQKRWGCSRCDSTLLVQTSDNKQCTYPKQGQFSRRVDKREQIAAHGTPESSSSERAQPQVDESDGEADCTPGDTPSSARSLASFEENEDRINADVDLSASDDTLLSASDASSTRSRALRDQLYIRSAPTSRLSALSLDRPYTVQDNLDEIRNDILKWKSKLSFMDEYDIGQSETAELSQYEYDSEEEYSGEEYPEEEYPEEDDDVAQSGSPDESQAIEATEHESFHAENSSRLMTSRRRPTAETDVSLCRKDRGLEVFYEELTSLVHQTQHMGALTDHLNQIKAKEGKELRMLSKLIEDMYVNWDNMPHLREKLVAYTMSNAMKLKERLSDLRASVHDRLARCVSPETYRKMCSNHK